MAKDKKVEPMHIRVEPLEKAFERFEAAWESVSLGGEQSFDACISFENFTALLSVLTPKRMTLLQTLRQKGPMHPDIDPKPLARLQKRLRRLFSPVMKWFIAIRNAPDPLYHQGRRGWARAILPGLSFHQPRFSYGLQNLHVSIDGNLRQLWNLTEQRDLHAVFNRFTDRDISEIQRTLLECSRDHPISPSHL
jgi:hypothetical protein